jgi:hypothetical protein
MNEHPGPDRSPSTLDHRLGNYSLLDALLNRRSRRFAPGMALNGGALAFQSVRSPQPLTLEQEAALAFAAAGISGYALAELPYATGNVPGAGGGNIMKQFLGRTAPSADALHAVTVFVLNDSGSYMLRRPQDFPHDSIAGLVEAAQRRELTALYERSRVKIADHRLDVTRELPFLPPFNRWSANVPGSTYFIPVNELTGLYINVLLSALGEDFNYFILDDRNGYKPAGIGRFARSKGGTLRDDPREGCVATVSYIEAWMAELAAIEQGAILQNLGLMAQALGLGGFPHFAGHPFGWTQALGFRMMEPPLSQIVAAGPVMKAGLKLLKKDVPVPTAVGLESGGKVLLQPFCPPYYSSMRDAVLALVDAKFSPANGVFRDGGRNTAFRDPAAVQAGIPPYTETAIEATIAYCEYVYGRHGRFPAAFGPFRTCVAYQAHHLDPDFYARHYQPQAMGDLEVSAR